MSPPDRSIQTYLALQPLLQKVAVLKQLRIIFEKYLPNPMREHCEVANWREGILIIETDSAVWKTQLLYLIPTLRIQLPREPEFETLKAIECYIRPAESKRVLPSKCVPLSQVGERVLQKLKSL